MAHSIYTFDSIDNASEKLDLETYDGSGETIHPDIVYFPDGWHGYKFWMVNTPYPNNDGALENPSIWCSNDGSSWVIPDGLTNPIVAKPASGVNTDPCIMYLSLIHI